MSHIKPQMLYLLQICLLASAHGVVGQQFFTTPSNVRGELLILDVGSLQFQGNHPMSAPLSQQGCADACARTPTCNAWTFCSNKDGCGSGCRAYTQSNPAVSYATGPGGDPTRPNPAWKQLKSITGFGPWGVTAGCKSECSGGSCKPGDVWPYGMCSLKRLPDINTPQFWPGNAAQGWVSGVLQSQPACAGVVASTCARCLASKDPSSCLKCARAPAFQLSMVDAALSPAPSSADGCAACFNAANPAVCVACLTGNQPCGQCVRQASGAALDVDACISCTNRLGPAYKDACSSCAALVGKSGQVDQCMACLNTMKPLACTKAGFQSGCWDPTVKPTSCSTCAASGASYEACVSCLTASPMSDSCEACTGLPAAKQAQCFQCSKKAAVVGTGCSDCLAYLPDGSTQQQQCLACMTNPAISAAGKTWCSGCQNWCSTPDSRTTCVACLGAKQEDYSQACRCA